jgi:hypothetical protein
MSAFNFSFNLLAKMTLAEKTYSAIANFINIYILRRNILVNTEFLYKAFNLIDAFWLKHSQSRWYNETQTRVIIGIILESIRDNNLSAQEVRRLSRYIVSKWKPEITPELEDKVARSLKVLDKVPSASKNIPLFVQEVAPKASSPMLISHIASSVSQLLR